MGSASVEMLLDHGAGPKIRDGSNMTPLNQAKANPKIVRLLIKHSADVSHGQRPSIFDIIESMDLPTVNLLVEMGTNFNIRPEQVPSKRADINKYVSKNHQRNDRENNNVQLVSRRVLEIITLFITHLMGYTNCTLSQLIIPLIKKFISFGVDINTPNKPGETPIFHYLNNSSDIENMAHFVDIGVDFRVKDGRGQSLPHVLAKKKYSELPPMWKEEGESKEVKVFRWLMEKGLDPMDEDEEQKTTLDLAAASGNMEILGLFQRS
jgi:ankyrin repeat protein